MVNEGVVDASLGLLMMTVWRTYLFLSPIQTNLLKMRGLRIFQLKNMVSTNLMMHISLMAMMMWVWIVGNLLKNPYMTPPARDV